MVLASGLEMHREQTATRPPRPHSVVGKMDHKNRVTNITLRAGVGAGLNRTGACGLPVTGTPGWREAPLEN